MYMAAMPTDTPIIIRGGQLVLPESELVGDLLIQDGKIARIGGPIDVAGATEIFAENLAVLPGLVDTHVHFREPGMTTKESLRSGSAAAVRGGVTSFLEMPNTRPRHH